jgi:type I site-specific restriction endonuclease
MDVFTVKTYEDASQFLSELDKQIKDLESLVKAVGDELERLKPSLERYKRLQELLKKFSSEGSERSAPIEITGLQLYIDPSPMVRHEILEESYRHMVDLLSVLKKVKEVAQSVIQEGGLETLRVSVQFKNGVPVKLIVTG